MRAGKVALGAGAGVLGAYGVAAARSRRRATQRYQLDDPPAPGTSEFARLVEAQSMAPLRSGNRAQVLRNGDETFPSMLDAIASAKSTIDFSSYIYWPGDITERFARAFLERAEAGVEVSLLLDGYGSAKLDRDHIHRLRRGGVTVAFFRPPRWHGIGNLNNRMHRRLLIVDGRVGFAGGVGVADVWTGDANGPDEWRETHLRIEGPAVRDLVGGFLENWTEATGQLLAGAHLPELASFDDGVELQVSRSSPHAGGTPAAELFAAAIAGAQHRLWLTTAYFSAGPRFMDALVDCARRGVDVRIIVNGKEVDKEVVRKTGQRSYGRLLEVGARVFEYDRTMLHAKTLVVDEEWANVGSSNFDHRSFGLDIELNVSIVDRGITSELAQHFLEDLEVSDEIDLARWRARPLRTRAFELFGEAFRQSF